MTEPRRLHRRENRLIRKADIQRVFHVGRRGGAKGLTLVVADSPTGVSRLGLAVSRRMGKAVRRNRIRRLIRESFRLLRPSFERPVDVVAMPRPGQFPDDLAAVQRAFSAALRRALDPRPGPARRPSGSGARSAP